MQQQSVFRKSFRRPKISRKLSLGLFGLAALGVAVFIGYRILNRDTGVQGAGVKPISQIITIEKSYVYPIKDQSGNTSGDLELTIKNAEKTNMVTVQQQTITAPEGKLFLILSMQWNNKSNAEASVNSSNFFRYLAADSLPYAPTFYNQNISILPISVGTDKVGFLIGSNEQSINVQVGEVSGSKEILKLDF